MAKNKGGFIGQFGLEAPDPPTGVSAAKGDAQATISFTAPTDVGGDAITGYRAQSNDGIGVSGSSSPITVTGLSNGTSYTFNVWAINDYGYSSPSDASGSVTPAVLQRALFAGGYPGPSNVIEYVDISTTGNTQDFGDLLANTPNSAGVGSGTRSVFAGNGDSVSDVIEYVAIATTGNSSDFGNLIEGNSSMAGMSSSTRGVFAGGYAAVGGNTNRIQYVTIASTGNATDFGDALTSGRDASIGLTGSSTRGLWANQTSGNTKTNTIQYVTIASTGNATDFGDTTVTRSQLAGVGSGTRAVFCGGTTGSLVDTMDYVTIASTGNATDFGDLSAACRLGAGASSATRGLIALGNTGSRVNTIEYITIASTGNSTDFGDLLAAKDQFAGCSSSHGGLQ